MKEEPANWTKPSIDQVRLISHLVDAVDSIRLPPNWQDIAQIALLDDGGMGSFLIRFKSIEEESNPPYRIVAELTFHDRDGTPVHASFFVNEYGNPAEIDLWKVDFSTLHSIPEDLPKGTPTTPPK